MISRINYPIVERSSVRQRYLVYHETAHYYFNEIGPYYAVGQPSPDWLVEGGANLMSAYINARLGLETLQERLGVVESRAREICHKHGFTNIHTLSDPALVAGSTKESTTARRCRYPLGEQLLINLFFTMGEPALSAALREVHLTGHHFRPKPQRHSVAYPSDLQLYQTFLKHTPPDRQDAVRDVYRRLHGGPFIPPAN